VASIDSLWFPLDPIDIFFKGPSPKQYSVILNHSVNCDHLKKCTLHPVQKNRSRSHIETMRLFNAYAGKSPIKIYRTTRNYRLFNNFANLLTSNTAVGSSATTHTLPQFIQNMHALWVKDKSEVQSNPQSQKCQNKSVVLPVPSPEVPSLQVYKV
jgi:hypothetical protein